MHAPELVIVCTCCVFNYFTRFFVNPIDPESRLQRRHLLPGTTVSPRSVSSASLFRATAKGWQTILDLSVVRLTRKLLLGFCKHPLCI